MLARISKGFCIFRPHKIWKNQKKRVDIYVYRETTFLQITWTKKKYARTRQHEPDRQRGFPSQSTAIRGCPQRTFVANPQRSRDMWIRTSCSLLVHTPTSIPGSSGLRVRALFVPPLTSPIWHCTPAVQRPNMDSVKESTVANPRKENQLVSPFSIILLGVIFYLYSLFFVKMYLWERFKKPKYEIFGKSGRNQTDSIWGI